MSLEILKTGVLDTVQDAGRPGYGKWGIGPGGVMDYYDSRIASALVGNDADAALVEMHFPAPHILFHRDAVVSITGAEMVPTLQGYEVPLWKPLVVKAGNVLTFQRRNKGARCYLAIRGGIVVAPWLGSCSTNLKINAGGFQGRALRKGDVIPVHDDTFPKVITGAFKVLPWSVNHTTVYRHLAAGEVGYRIFGVVLWCAAITSVVGSAYTSVSFLRTFHSFFEKHHVIIITFFIMCSAVIFLIVGRPVSILITVGALNAFILPLALGIILFASRKAVIVNQYRHPWWMTIAGWVVVVALGLMSIYTLVADFGRLWNQ